MYSKLRYKKQIWMQGWHSGKLADLFNWPKFRLTKLVFFRARAINQGIHACVYPHMSKGYLQPLVYYESVLTQVLGHSFVYRLHSDLAKNIDP